MCEPRIFYKYCFSHAKTMFRGSSSTLTHLAHNLDTAITRPDPGGQSIHRSFLIGGASLYAESLALPPSSHAFVDRVMLTRIISPAFDDCDVFMPDFIGKDDGENEWQRASHDALKEWVGFEVPEGVQTENGVNYEFQMWVREP